MKNEDYIKPNPLELESLRSELIEKTLSTTSNNLRLFLYQNYFEKILSLNNPNFEEAFLKEFLDDYISCIFKFEAWGVELDISINILEQLKKVSTLNIASNNLTSLNSEIERIEKQLEKLTLILDGKECEDGEIHKAFFPLIDNETPTGFYGIIESITVRINKNVDVDKFIIVPSEKEIEKKILEQCKKSWELALNLSKKYVKKPFKYHEVIISFDKKQGFYEGNSLGIALTLSFLEQILKFYNPAYIINIKEQSAFTGGVTEIGEVLCTSEEIIKRKVAAVFFSEINTFVFPKCEETYAYFALTQLKQNYPNRKLKLIPVEEINDVLNRRDVVDIKKQKLVVRGGKFVKKNWISAVATVLLAILFAYLFVMDFDDNPASVSADGQFLFIKNKNGRLLWKRNLNLEKLSVGNENYLSKFCKLIDINSDGISEVLIANEQVGNPNELNTVCLLKCFDKNQKLLWQFSFNEKANSLRENLDTAYSIYMIDTLVIKNRKSLYVFANNGNSFSSAIFAIDLSTRKINTGVLWCSGHTYEGLIKDINGDGKKDMFCLGIDNGFEDVVLFGIEIDSANRIRPTTSDYLVKGYPVADFISYIRIPKTDYENYIQHRFSNIGSGSFTYLNNEKKYYFVLTSDNSIPVTGIWYKLDENLKDFNITIDNQFRVKRDTLVAQGKLKLPYSDRKEYENILKTNILYWENGKWVKRDERD